MKRTYLVVIVLHQLPIELALLGPRKVIFHLLPIHTSMFQHILLIQCPILLIPRYFWFRTCIEIGIDKSISICVNMNGKEPYRGRIESWNRVRGKSWSFGQFSVQVI